MPKYRFKDDKITFSDITDIFERFEDVYAEIFNENHQTTFVEDLHSIITDCNEKVEMADVEMYDEEKNGAIVFSIRSKYKCLRTIALVKIYITELFCKHRFISYSECELHKLANTYLEYLEYFFTYSYMVRDKLKQKINSKYGYFDTDMISDALDRLTIRQPLNIPCDGKDTGV